MIFTFYLFVVLLKINNIKKCILSVGMEKNKYKNNENDEDKNHKKIMIMIIGWVFILLLSFIDICI